MPFIQNQKEEFLVPSKYKSTILVFTKENENNFIHEGFYVPHLNVNLISIVKLLHNQYDIRFYDTYCAIYDKHPIKRLIAKVEMTNSIIFSLSLTSANLPQFVGHTVSSLDESWL